MTPQDRMLQIAESATTMSKTEGFDAPTILQNILANLNDCVGHDEATILLADREEAWFTRIVGITAVILRMIDPQLKDASACAAFYVSGVLQWKVENPDYQDCDWLVGHLLRTAQTSASSTES